MTFKYTPPIAPTSAHANDSSRKICAGCAAAVALRFACSACSRLAMGVVMVEGWGRRVRQPHLVAAAR